MKISCGESTLDAQEETTTSTTLGGGIIFVQWKNGKRKIEKLKNRTLDNVKIT